LQADIIQILLNPDNDTGVLGSTYDKVPNLTDLIEKFAELIEKYEKDPVLSENTDYNNKIAELIRKYETTSSISSYIGPALIGMALLAAGFLIFKHKNRPSKTDKDKSNIRRI
jgi:hypothetical protein